MTRGTIGIITNDGVYMSAEFNGNMYPSGKGGAAIEALLGLGSAAAYGGMIEMFDSKYFGYSLEHDEPLYGTLYSYTNDTSGFDFSEGYYRNFGSDYIYIRNMSDKDFPVTDINKNKTVISAGETVCFNFGVKKDISEYITGIKGFSTKPDRYDKAAVSGKWLEEKGFVTAGGDPVYICPSCKNEASRHVYGTEHRRAWKYCPCCGTELSY